MSEKKVSYKMDEERPHHNLKEILRGLMAEKDIDDTRLAKATGVAISSLSRIKNDPFCNPTLASLQPLAEFFGVTVSQLIGETSLNRSYIAEPNKRRTLVVLQVPLVQWDEIETFLADKLTEFNQWVPSNLPLSKQAFALCVQNTTWGNLFCQGSYLLADPEVNAVDGDYVVVHNQADKNYYIKRLVIEGSDKYLQSLNPDIKLTEKIKNTESITAVIVEIRQIVKAIK